MSIADDKEKVARESSEYAPSDIEKGQTPGVDAIAHAEKVEYIAPSPVMQNVVS
jgi:hypothetical protein